MERLVRAIDFMIDIVRALGGGGPEAGSWRNVERFPGTIAAMILSSVLCFIVAVKVIACFNLSIDLRGIER